MKDLALEVRGIDDIVVHESETPDAGGGEVKGGGRTERAAADEEDGGVFQAQLPLFADCGMSRWRE